MAYLSSTCHRIWGIIYEQYRKVKGYWFNMEMENVYNLIHAHLWIPFVSKETDFFPYTSLVILAGISHCGKVAVTSLISLRHSQTVLIPSVVQVTLSSPWSNTGNVAKSTWGRSGRYMWSVSTLHYENHSLLMRKHAHFWLGNIIRGTRCRCIVNWKNKMEHRNTAQRGFLVIMKVIQGNIN